jgi:dihydrofolate reductase
LKISIIVAASANNVIGIDGDLPWRLSEDLKNFKAITMGKPMIMGRATFESIGRALPGRRSIVLSRQAGFEAEGCDVVSSLAEALELAGDVEEIMVIGGGKIYEQFLPIADRIYLTRIDASIEGDTWLPEIDPGEWTVVESESYPAGDEREYGFTFETWNRIQTASS